MRRGQRRGPQGEGGLALGDIAVADAVRAVGGDAEGGVEPVKGPLGGAELPTTFVSHGLIDEYRLNVRPVVIEGQALFQPSDSKSNLRLAETRIFGNRVVLLHYPAP